MKAVAFACAATLLASTQAFIVPGPKAAAPKAVVKGTPFNTVDPAEMAVENKALAGMSVFERAMADFNTKYPAPASRGLGPSTKAERWNGRHAMAGWIALLATGYAQAHNLIPTGGLDPNVWGQWVITSYDAAAGAYNTIPTERAVVAIAHLHLAAVGVFAAFNKESVKDKLLLEVGEKDEPAAGLFVPFKLGLTKEAELLNGRLAMLGLTALVVTCAATGQDPLSVMDQALGGLLLKA